jgi:hypothetical protein
MTEENFFKVPVPDNVACQVMEYHWGRATLLVRLRRQNSPEVQYIRFSGVEYFAGPMVWNGAAFDLRDPEECLNVLRDAGRVNDLVDVEQLVTHGLHLYTVTLPQTLVCVVAKQASRYSA